MNMLTCRLESAGEAVKLAGDGVNVPCPDAALKALASAGRTFLVGFRPEDVEISGDDPNTGFGGVVVAVEELDHESLVTVSADAEQFMARLSPAIAERVRLGDCIGFAVDPAKLRFFNSQTGTAISVNDDGRRSRIQEKKGR